jgi:hypothetical protein
MTSPPKRIGRPPKLVKQINPQVQFGRREQADIDAIDAAAAAAGMSRAEWAWEVLLEAAKWQARRSEKK